MMTVAELADFLEGEVVGASNGRITSVAGLREAGAQDLSFLNNPKYRGLVAKTGAGAVLVPQDWDAAAPVPLIRVPNPDAAFAKATLHFRPPPVEYAPGIHPTAIIPESASIGPDAHIGPYVVIGEDVVIGERCTLLAGANIGPKAQLGDDVMLHAHVVLRENVMLGSRVIIHNHTVIGSDGFGYSVDDKGVRTKVPQVGTVRIGDDVEIGASVCVDRARFGETRIGNGVKIDNLVQIAHNVVIGDHVVLVSQVGISGSTVVEPHAILAGQVGVAGHLTIGSKAVVGAQGGVTKDVAPGSYVWGTPATPFDKYSKNLAQINRLPKLQAKVAALEATLRDLQTRLDVPPVS